MQAKFNQFKPLILIGGVFVALVFMIYIATTSLFKTQADLETRREEVAKLEKKLAVLDSNKALTQTQIDEYNKILSKLIPDQEDYFSILFALEQLSLDTGFQISRYFLQISENTPEKLVVTVEGDGDSDTFLKFLNDYQFAGGRLITNENLEYASDRIGQIRLTLNFYNKKVDISAESGLVELTPAQISLMRRIQSKTSIVLKSEEPALVDYPVKANPF